MHRYLEPSGFRAQKLRVTHAVSDFYRCPQELVALSCPQVLNTDPGFFRLGSALCYGQSAYGSVSDLHGTDVPDLQPHVRYDNSSVSLPFDVSAVLENFRCERYPIDPQRVTAALLSSKAARRFYYVLRPLLHQAVRSPLQRFFFRDWSGVLFPRWPVDTSVEQLFEKILLLCMRLGKEDRIPFIWFWPQGASAAAIMTHDVETTAGALLVEALIDVDDEFGIKSSFQIVPEERYPVPSALLDLIRRRECEVNVHGLNHDGDLFRDRRNFQKRSKSINRYAKEFGSQGFRSPCMYRNTDFLEDLDVLYDMSVPNVAHLEPQRGGCCTVFPYFIGNILELPLTTIQDYSLFHILGDYSIGLWEKQIDLIAEKHGLISFIVHPDYIMQEKPLAIYRQLLAHLSKQREEKNLWITRPGDVNRWWRERSAMKLVAENGYWRIQGPGSERARIAFASLDGERIVYRIGQTVEPRADFSAQQAAPPY
jgi:hypothetical protein